VADTPQAVPPSSVEEVGIAVVRALSMDAPHAARSGHQGTAMALAPLAHVLFTRVLRYDAAEPAWDDRDRLVLSAGHASILLYAYLYLTGHGLELDDLREFRQLGSATPGHPEAGHTAGVEVTTGPLGQGFANAVGMAVAERLLRNEFGADVCDHHTYVVCSDGDLMEGVSHEAASLAGHLGLGRIVAVFDDNRITIDGGIELACGDDVVGRFESYGWHVEDLGDVADDLDALEGALRRAAAIEDRPSLLVLRSHVGSPSPTHTDDPAAHGYVLKDAEIRATKEALGLPPDESFWVPDEVLDHYRVAGRRGQAERLAWERRVDALDEATRNRYEDMLDGSPAPGWEDLLPTWKPGEQVATRVASQDVLRALQPSWPALVAGAADLTGNVGLSLADAQANGAAHPAGRQLYFGIREHAMAAAAVGMARHGGVLPVVGTFFVFSDYMRPALRLAALSGARVVFVFSHDSVGVGEDGPTHQPVEQLAGLRAMPGLAVFRPADANETAGAWAAALDIDGPSALVLSRQNLPVLAEAADNAFEGARRGGYVVWDSDADTDGGPELILVGTGSEVALCLDAARELAEEVSVRVVSLPCWELFAAQDDAYQESVFPVEAAILAVEAASSFGWERWADDVIGIDHFGASAPASELFDQFGFDTASVVERSRLLLAAVYGDPDDGEYDSGDFDDE